jgi:hypothetical protein
MGKLRKYLESNLFLKILISIGFLSVAILFLLIIYLFIKEILYINLDFDKIKVLINLFIICLICIGFFLVPIIFFFKKRIWFYLTILFMFVVLVMGFFSLHFFGEKENFARNLSVLFSIVLFSLPVGMYNLKCLFKETN